MRIRTSDDTAYVRDTTTEGRAGIELIKAILSRNEQCRLVAVGDDWQSIYRFAGSDVRLMLDFENEFGAAVRSDLVNTHRFGDKLRIPVQSVR